MKLSSLILYATPSAGVQDTYEDLFLRGLELAGEGRDVEAIQVFRTAVERDPEQAPVLAALYEKEGDKPKAWAALGRCLELRPDDIEARILPEADPKAGG